MLIGLLYALAMSLIPEPQRRRFNAIMVAGAGAAYLSGGGGRAGRPLPHINKLRAPLSGGAGGAPLIGWCPIRSGRNPRRRRRVR
ncbi:DUF6010 family protein [Nocardia abscessus]|uniref:DUF6010 family protein n=1 Tax=Nocardia abscessus TaxID=120957 RepID=UPI0024540D56|nr:DUF6010 family protein [Nocardia abscessus]